MPSLVGTVTKGGQALGGVSVAVPGYGTVKTAANGTYKVASI